MSNDEYHVTRVITLTDGFQASCTPCGRFGPKCEREIDAWVIADRHASIQGFER